MPPRPRLGQLTTWYSSAPLCRQLADRVGWQSFAEHYWKPDGFVISHDHKSQKELERWQAYGKEDDWNVIPAFELGWLVRQLTERRGDAQFQLAWDGSLWAAGYNIGPHVKAATPEDAVAQLLLELVEQGDATAAT
jgi:hypothetical protein